MPFKRTARRAMIVAVAAATLVGIAATPATANIHNLPTNLFPQYGCIQQTSYSSLCSNLPSGWTQRVLSTCVNWDNDGYRIVYGRLVGNWGVSSATCQPRSTPLRRGIQFDDGVPVGTPG